MSLSILATSTIPSTSITKPPRSNVKTTRSTVGVRKGIAYISCEQKQTKQGDNHTIDRRNVLLGMGGLYGATTVVGNQVADGAPVSPPDLSNCHFATNDETKEKVKCCPPYTSANIIDFVPPGKDCLRIRKPAHKLRHEEIEKYKLAVSRMKELPAEHPWNFMQQATIHCTYCNGAFDQVGFPNVALQIHQSFLFAPWHRYYIYFWEKILGKLIGDPTFSIPYWAWDTPEGMYMPKMYLDTSSPLYDDNRNHNHYNALMNYDYSLPGFDDYDGFGISKPVSDHEIKIRNLRKIHNIFRETIGCPRLFMGTPLRAGQTTDKGAGSLENIHGLPHQWTGAEDLPYYDMGNFYTAARDTIFFGHHANVDKLWHIYSDRRGNKVEFNDPDWLEASFIFMDENTQVVRCKVKDCLSIENLGYSYQTERHEWIDINKSYKRLQKDKKRSEGEGICLTKVSEFGSEARHLDSTIRVLVPRPKTSRSKDEKEDAIEVLIIDHIKFGHGESMKFDVYIAKPIEGLVGPDLGEHVGSFIRVEHSHDKKDHVEESKIELGINNLLDDIAAETSDSLVVSLVPRTGDLIVGGVHIDLFESDI